MATQSVSWGIVGLQLGCAEWACVQGAGLGKECVRDEHARDTLVGGGSRTEWGNQVINSHWSSKSAPGPKAIQLLAQAHGLTDFGMLGVSVGACPAPLCTPLKSHTSPHMS